MPIYEFYSPDTHKIYSFYARRIMPSSIIPQCPDNPKFRMERTISRFAVTGRAKEENPSAAADDAALDPRQEAAMAQLAREMERLPDNPDPRTLGKLMRQMGELSGQDLPLNFQEMVERLEKGEDPEQLEQEYADAFENIQPSIEESASSDGLKPKRLHHLPTRDPHLYEMSDYLKNR